MLDAITVPSFARATDYLGLWAIEPQAGAAMWHRARAEDLPRHVAETQAAPPKLRSDLQIAKASSGQNVGIVMLTGPLMKAVSSTEAGTSTVQARRDIRKAANDPDVSAILLAIDSPGGTVAGTADLAAEVRAASKKKPVWAYVADLGASAAYWIASQADKVLANDRTALVGSIGTVAVVYDLSAAAEMAGVKTLVIGTGPLKGAGAPGAPVTEEQQAYYRGIVEDAQKSFDSAVKKGRGMTDAQLADAKTGGVFGATEALDRGLIDGISTFDAALEDLAAEARRAKRMAKQESSNRADSPQPLRSTTVEETVTTAGASVAPVETQIVTETQSQSVTHIISDVVAQTRRAAVAESARVAGIQAAAREYNVPAEKVTTAIENGTSARDFEFGAMREALSGNKVRPFNPAIVVRDNAANVEALQAALILRGGGKLDHRAYNGGASYAAKLPGWLRADLNSAERDRVMNAAHRFQSLSAIDICREAVRMDGKDVPMDRTELVASATSGGTLTNIFTTSMNAILLASYMEAGDTTGGWVREADVADFKTNERPRMEVISGTMSKLPRGGKADHAQRSDKAESYKIARYAEQFVIDEQDIIDDSLNAFDQTPRDMAMKAARLRPDLVYSILLSNPTLTATARALFNTTDGNLGSSSALASATLRTACASFLLVRENAANLNLRPTHLIVPPTLLHTAKELVNSSLLVIAGSTDATRGNANPLQDWNLSIVSDARLENGVVNPDDGTTNVGSSSTWYMASNQAHTIEVGYLRGTGRAPQVRPFVLDKGRYGMGWDICLDIGAKAMDWRGLRKTTA